MKLNIVMIVMFVLLVYLYFFNIFIFILGYDHHCPWTSKCVGKKNLWIFNCFLISLGAHIIYLVFALVSLAIYSGSINKNKKIK